MAGDLRWVSVPSGPGRQRSYDKEVEQLVLRANRRGGFRQYIHCRRPQKWFHMAWVERLFHGGGLPLPGAYAGGIRSRNLIVPTLQHGQAAQGLDCEFAAIGSGAMSETRVRDTTVQGDVDENCYFLVASGSFRQRPHRISFDRAAPGFVVFFLYTIVNISAVDRR